MLAPAATAGRELAGKSCTRGNRAKQRHRAILAFDQSQPFGQRLTDRLTDLRAEAALLPLDTLVERTLETFDYDLSTLLMDAGRRRTANLRKLVRIATEYEAHDGRDLRGFLQFSQGGKVLNMVRIFADDGGNSSDNKLAIVMNRWQKPGDITDQPRMGSTGGARCASGPLRTSMASRGRPASASTSASSSGQP